MKVLIAPLYLLTSTGYNIISTPIYVVSNIISAVPVSFEALYILEDYENTQVRVLKSLYGSCFFGLSAGLLALADSLQFQAAIINKFVDRLGNFGILKPIEAIAKICDSLSEKLCLLSRDLDNKHNLLNHTKKQETSKITTELYYLAANSSIYVSASCESAEKSLLGYDTGYINYSRKFLPNHCSVEKSYNNIVDSYNKDGFKGLFNKAWEEAPKVPKLAEQACLTLPAKFGREPRSR